MRFPSALIPSFWENSLLVVDFRGFFSFEETARGTWDPPNLQQKPKETWHDSGCSAPISRTCTGDPGHCGTTADWVPWDKNGPFTTAFVQQTNKAKQGKTKQNTSQNKAKHNKLNELNKQRTSKEEATHGTSNNQQSTTSNQQPITIRLLFHFFLAVWGRSWKIFLFDYYIF